MFTEFYATNLIAASEIKASDRLSIWGDTYLVTAYSVPAPGQIKIWVSPEQPADGPLVHNPLETITVSREYKFELAK